MILASESGVLPIPEEKIKRKWRLQPGKMLLIDLEEGRIVEDEEIKAKLATAEPTRTGCVPPNTSWKNFRTCRKTIAAKSTILRCCSISSRPSANTDEDLKFFLEPMAAVGDDPLGSMGADTPIAVLSKKPKLLYNYFKQNFAQVTNPPIDPIREELVMSLVSMIGPRPNLLGP